MNIMNTHSEVLRLFNADWRVYTKNTTAYFLAFFERTKNNYLLLEPLVNLSEVYAQA